MMLTHGDTAVVRRERMRGHFMRTIRPSCPRLLERDRARRPPQEGGGEGVAVPAQIGRQPLENLEAAFAALALDPRHRHLPDRPTEAMGLHQQLDAVAEPYL